MMNRANALHHNLPHNDVSEHKQEAWVVFTHNTEIPWLKMLKSGFRHCFIVLNDGVRWMSIDPLAPYTDVQIYHHIDSQYALPNWLKQQGYEVVKATIDKGHRKVSPLVFFSCVETIKRILGIHQRFIVTPWQLYRFLKKKNKSQILKGNSSWAV